MEDEDLKPIEIVERIASAVKPKLPQDTQREEEMQTVMQEEEEEDDGLAHEHEHKTSTRMQRIVSESTIDPTKLSDEQLEEELVFLISSISIRYSPFLLSLSPLCTLALSPCPLPPLSDVYMAASRSPRRCSHMTRRRHPSILATSTSQCMPSRCLLLRQCAHSTRELRPCASG